MLRERALPEVGDDDALDSLGLLHSPAAADAIEPVSDDRDEDDDHRAEQRQGNAKSSFGRETFEPIPNPDIGDTGDFFFEFFHGSFCFNGLSVVSSHVAVLDDAEAFEDKSVRIVVRALGVHQLPVCDEAALGNGHLAYDPLPGVGLYVVRIAVEVADHAIDDDPLVNVARNDTVVVPLLRQIAVVLEGCAVGEVERTLNIALDGRFVGREREEEFVEMAHVLPRFDWAVLREVLRQRQHQGLALVQHVYLLSLRLGEVVCAPNGISRKQSAGAEEYDAEQTKMTEGTLDVR